MFGFSKKQGNTVREQAKYMELRTRYKARQLEKLIDCFNHTVLDILAVGGSVRLPGIGLLTPSPDDVDAVTITTAPKTTQAKRVGRVEFIQLVAANNGVEGNDYTCGQLFKLWCECLSKCTADGASLGVIGSLDPGLRTITTKPILAARRIQYSARV